ncbi:DUF1553 domain-containing protein [Planctomicrobium piriforme]|uniref:Planctomycete cytochrome C n=1 Tax=Planctomicrobium piriforme TaxID=1576369 RepID=A0A1I3I9D0_9PLAN|nr:DUF1553 domain-containing protein [Planctomicrobium piriforme]SFI44615.1 Planctomycete cytochrome C [Planctomicrobium piriforme]
MLWWRNIASAVSRRRVLAICLFAGLAAVSLPAAEPAASKTKHVEYNRDIRPILADKCFVCHGPDKGNRQAELRLDTPEGAFAALASDASLKGILPGDPAHSAVYQRITSTDDAERMPPPDSNLQLTAQQVDLMRQWITQGAAYQPHWAFLAPRKSNPPTTTGQPWGRNDIDPFVLARMREHGLEPNPPASREQLIRRVTFDLTGLPPTLEEIDAFLNDASPQAYEKVVDRLLASDRFGERMAAEWLDVARYSDTYGFQVDRDRFVWPWRDWVIRAFNRDLPYDQFITQQLAGDLLPNATQEEILATTFCRLHPQEAEGGSIPEEYRVGYVADRIQTVSTAMLGMTLECCRCHDHKYDPLSQKEYFELFAFFDDIDESGLYSYFTPAIPTPTLLLTDPQSEQKLKAARDEIEKREQALVACRNEQQAAFEDWRKEFTALPEALPGQIAHLPFDQVAAPNQTVPGKVGTASSLTGDDAINTEVGNFHCYEPFSVSLWMNAPNHKERAVVFHRSRAWTDAGSRGYELLIEDGKLSAALIHFDPGNSLRVRTKTDFPLNAWQHVAVTYDGSSRASGLQIFINGQPADVEIVRDQLTKDITGGGGDNIAIGERFRDHGFTHGLVDEFRVFARELTPIEIQSLSLAPKSNEPDLLFEYFLKTQSAEYQNRLSALRDARRAESEMIESIPEIMVMHDMPSPKQAYRLERGDYFARAEEVFAGTPAVFPDLPKDAPQNRLGFARWLTSPDHPLTARVAVNRYWQMLFGSGLVRTTEDLGNQGEWPSHPELLDTLSRRWMEAGWSVKWLLKQMVMSDTYCQSAIVSPEKEAADPANRWLTRAASYRLTAEMLRDNALAASGLLVDKIGGPPAKPYEVEVAFKPLPRDTGEGLYRRSLYTFWSRTGPAPVMMALDAAKRDVCQVRRERTLSPLQPLVLLNGPQFVEAARMLAERVLKTHPDDPQASLIDLFRWTTSRRPTDQELAILKRLYDEHLADFQAHPDQAVAFLSVGDHPRDEKLDQASLAALSGVANMLLNFDECVFRR